ncbi:hypothetical protein [Mesobacterium pallidum]|uniref:hypothetical protein n=1 Tax=Mesobacterium pallidum TaxID=2872037 RepID=UPI001EE31A18|nr:hypothetical protein [Mesobacterium pallidum]
MFATLIIAALAGGLSDRLIPHVTRFLHGLLPDRLMPDAGGRRVAAFGAALLGAAVLLDLLGDGAQPVTLLLGGLLGAFHREIRQALLERMD